MIRQTWLVTMSKSGPGQPDRLAELVEWQRQELSRARLGGSVRSVTDLATGILMERLHCPAAEAEEQLTALAAGANVTVAELASEIAGVAEADDITAALLDGNGGPAVTASGPDAAPVPALGGQAWVSVRAAADAARIADALLAEALAAEGVTAVAIWLTSPDGGLELGGEAGFGSEEAARWRRVPPGIPTPAARAAGSGTGIWWPRGRPPEDDLPVIGVDARAARAVLPLDRRGVSIGALEARWPGPVGDFPERVRRRLGAVAEVCVQALTAGGGARAADYSAAWLNGLLDGLHESALIARPVAGDRGPAGQLVIEWVSERFDDPAGRVRAEVVGHQLLEIYPDFARAGGLYDHALQALRTGQPTRLTDVVLVAPGAVAAVVQIAPYYDGVVIAWRLATDADRLGALLDLAQHIGRIGSWQEDLVAGDVVWTDETFGLLNRPRGSPVRLADLPGHVLAEDEPAAREFSDRVLRLRERATAALRVVRDDDGSVRQLRAVAQPVTGPDGSLIAVRGAYQDVSPQLHTQIAFDATREQLTGAEEREAGERQLALRLQQAITPQASQLVAAAGLDVAARYRQAGSASLVSGDWYDAVVLPDKQVLVAVGDVAGHGLDAVNGMVALRNYLHGLAVTGAGPAQLLAWLNSAACEPANAVFATAICALYDPVARTLRWARAGHLPPLLIRDGTAQSLPLPAGVGLGLDAGSTYSESGVSLEFGDVLMLFTDGLVESRTVPLDETLAQLARRASRPVPDIGTFADDILAGSLADTGDDACLLAVSFR